MRPRRAIRILFDVMGVMLRCRGPENVRPGTDPAAATQGLPEPTHPPHGGSIRSLMWRSAGWCGGRTPGKECHKATAPDRQVPYRRSVNLPRRIAADVRRGENIDVYLTIVVALSVAVLNLIGVVPASSLTSLV